jgi:tetratricopeptide (TPR) repeat protein
MSLRPLSVLLFLALTACRPDASEHLQRGHDARFERRYEEALGEYRRALEVLEREDAGTVEVLRARILKAAADVYWSDMGKARDAVVLYRELIEVCPDAPETLESRVALARLLADSMNDRRGAIDVLEGAIQRNPPQVAELSYRKASLYFSLGDYAQAEVEASRLIQRYSTSAWVDDALFLRGQSLAMLEGRREEAARSFTELEEKLSDSELVPHAIFERGRLLAEAGEREKAIEVWVSALPLHPTPQMVQDSIARTRALLRAAAHEGTGQAAAFNPARRARTSVEALGLSAP